MYVRLRIKKLKIREGLFEWETGGFEVRLMLRHAKFSGIGFTLLLDKVWRTCWYVDICIYIYIHNIHIFVYIYIHIYIYIYKCSVQNIYKYAQCRYDISYIFTNIHRTSSLGGLPPPNCMTGLLLINWCSPAFCNINSKRPHSF